MARVLIVGGRGMLGCDLEAAACAAGHDVAIADLPEVDITRPLDAWNPGHEFDWVINCAAYTDVDKAESEPALAYAVNRDGAANLAAWCRTRGARLAHLSTDYVFDGMLGRPYREDDAVHPLGVYGASKLAGELAVREILPDALVVRTQALFGLHGRHFIRAIQRRLREGPYPVTVVADHTTCPTYTAHLAQGVLRLIEAGATGMVHASATGTCSWYEYAVAIAENSGSHAPIRPVPAAEFPRPAKRPAHAELDKSRLAALTGASLPDWRVGLRAYLAAAGGLEGVP